jgi:hypothetical protein
MSKQNGGCPIALLIILFSEALLPFACLPFIAPFIIADADPETRRSILTFLGIIVIGVLWFWLKSRSRRKKGGGK